MTPLKHGFKVSVLVELGYRDNGEFDPDLCKYEDHEFATRKAAVAGAAKLLPQDAFGEIIITPFTRNKYGEQYDWDKSEIVCKSGVVPA